MSNSFTHFTRLYGRVSLSDYPVKTDTRFQKVESRLCFRNRIRVGGGSLADGMGNTRAVYETFFKKNFPTKNLQVIHK